jgi:hypothetical protein
VNVDVAEETSDKGQQGFEATHRIICAVSTKFHNSPLAPVGRAARACCCAWASEAATSCDVCDFAFLKYDELSDLICGCEASLNRSDCRRVWGKVLARG